MKFILIPFAVFGLDEAVKQYIDKTMPCNEPKKICRGKVTLQKCYNTGAAGGVLSEKPKLVAILQAVFLFAAAVCFAAAAGKKRAKTAVAAGMLFGGGMSNFYDRIKRRHVVDYVRVPVRGKRMQHLIFNISDFFILAGALLLALFGSAES